MSQAAPTSRLGGLGIEPHVWRIASVTIVGSIMSILDMTVVNVALESLGRDLGSSIAEIQWIVTGYTLALAAVIPVSGWAARRFGARNVYVGSLALFTLGSLLCGIAWDTGSLVGFRVLQGLGGGMLLPVGQMLVARAAGPERMGRVMSILGVPIVLAPVLGPALGGLLLDGLGWRWIFFINLPIGALALAMAWRRLPRTPPDAVPGLDGIGFVLLGVGLPALTYGLAELGIEGGLGSAKVVAPLVAGVALVGLFAWHALRARHPLLDLRLFANRAYAAATVTTFSLGAAIFGGMILLPLYFQDVRGESAVVTGLLIAPQGLGAGLAMPLAGRLTDQVGGGIVCLVGMVATALTSLPLVFVDESTSYGLLSLLLVLRGFAIGIAIMPAMAAAYAVIRPDQIADATPQLNVVQRVGGSIGTALLAVVLERAIIARGSAPPALADAYGVTYWWIVAVSLLGTLPAAVLWRIERRHRFERAARAAAPGVGAAAPVTAPTDG
ncbi:MAG: DHA2 family efflux MFS transporter permease subunit [Thermoleophilia bacterium]